MEDIKVRIVDATHLLYGVVGTVVEIKIYRGETKVLVAFGNFEQSFDIKHVKKAYITGN